MASTELWLGSAQLQYGPKQVVVRIAEETVESGSIKEKWSIIIWVKFFLQKPLYCFSLVWIFSRVVASTEGALPWSDCWQQMDWHAGKDPEATAI